MKAWTAKLIFFVVLALGLLVVPLAADAQAPAKVPRIGYLGTGSVSTHPLEAFRQGLRELGYVEGQSITIEYRFAEGKGDRLPDLADELVRLKVALIIAESPLAIRAAKQATDTIPIVMAVSGDPVASGFVASLARPGGNITGLSHLAPELNGKRLELLKEAVPRVSRVAALLNPTNPAAAASLRETQIAARSLGMQLQILEVRGVNDLDSAFSAMTRERGSALIVLPDAMLHSQKRRIVDFAAKSQLPAVYYARDYAEAGGLLAYGASFPDLFRHAATYVHKILKGAKPADLPVEQPTRFELVINLKTARALGLTIPPSLLMRADQVIQ